jgi:hypothetical protein
MKLFKLIHIAYLYLIDGTVFQKRLQQFACLMHDHKNNRELIGVHTIKVIVKDTDLVAAEYNCDFCGLHFFKQERYCDVKLTNSKPI